VSIKHFCDNCGHALDSGNTLGKGNVLKVENDTPSRGGVSFYVHLTASTSPGGSPVGDLCKHCVIDAVNKLDDRPKQAPAPLVPALSIPTPRGTSMRIMQDKAQPAPAVPRAQPWQHAKGAGE
jgi:hypothetical protein